MIRSLNLSLFGLFILFASLLPAQTVGHTATGLASYFSDAFDGSETVYKQIYRKSELVAAHKVYPLNSRVLVTNLENNRQVTVRIIDQGPFIKGRIIEVSSRAAEILGFGDENTVRVRIELISTPDQPARESAPVASSAAPATRAASQPPTTTTSSSATAATAQPRPSTRVAERAPAPTQAERVVSTPVPAPATRATTPPVRETTTTSPERRSSRTYRPDNAEQPLVTAGTFGDGIYKIEIREAGPGLHGVQVASFGDLESAMQQVTRLQAKWFDNILIRKVGPAYKVILGPFDDHASATRYAKDLKSRYKMDGFAVTLPE